MSNPATSCGATLRPVQASDEPFLLELYSSTRQEELAALAWSDQQKRDFLRMQFHAQTRFYQAEYPGAAFQVIEVNGRSAGRWYLHPREREIRIMDVALLPEFRGRGIGTELLLSALREGRERGQVVSSHVEVFTRAGRLYERLGFKQVATNGLYHLLEWSPEPTTTPCALPEVGAAPQPSPAAECLVGASPVAGPIP
jgi:ribosomal protein S18 acetylase RimI-like enzyme